MIVRKVINQVEKTRRAVRLFLARQAGVEIGPDTRIGAQVEFDTGVRDGRRGAISIGENVCIEQGTVLRAYGGSIRLQRNVFLGQYAVIYGHGGVEIGEDALISMHVSILSSNHTVPDRKRSIRDLPDTLLPTKIGRDVWLGAGVRVLGGVTIGQGCVVGAGAVVTDDLPDYAIAVGVPARVIGNRA